MVSLYAHLPDDIAEEKRTRNYLNREYKRALFGSIRNFRALRREAPGVIAEFLLGATLSVAALLALYHDLNVKGLIPTVWFCAKVVLIIGMSFLVAGRIWVAVGLANRNRVRYVIANLWFLAYSAIFAVGTVLAVFFPDQVEKSPPGTAAPTVAVANDPTIVTRAPIDSHERPVAERTFAGMGWQILHNDIPDYETSLVKQASGRCRQFGNDWLLADQRDFEELEAEILDGGHVGSFWTASKRPNSNLNYFINANGSTEFRWANSGKYAEKIVLCVLATAI